MAELNNYQKTQKRAEGEFLRYDQERMIAKCNLEHDEHYLYINYFSLPYRIDRHSGLVQRLLADGGIAEAGFNEAMAIFDVLCEIKPDRYLSGVWVGIEKFSNTAFVGSTLFRPYAEAFDNKAEALAAACMRYGGCSCFCSGDVSCQLPLFDFFPVIFRFWNGDEELLPTIRFLWDAHTKDYLRFETMFYAMDFILERLAAEIEAE